MAGFYFDNQEEDDFDYNPQTGAFRWQVNAALSEGVHRYLIRAVDSHRNVAGTPVVFTVNSSAGVITMSHLPGYTRRERIPISGTCEPNLSLELWRGNEVLSELRADNQGQYRFNDVALNNRQNGFMVVGWDDADNVARAASGQVYRDVAPPEVTFLTPLPFEPSPTPEVTISAFDAGVGINEEPAQRYKGDTGGIRVEGRVPLTTP